MAAVDSLVAMESCLVVVVEAAEDEVVEVEEAMAICLVVVVAAVPYLAVVQVYPHQPVVVAVVPLPLPVHQLLVVVVALSVVEFEGCL